MPILCIHLSLIHGYFDWWFGFVPSSSGQSIYFLLRLTLSLSPSLSFYPCPCPDGAGQICWSSPSDLGVHHQVLCEQMGRPTHPPSPSTYERVTFTPVPQAEPISRNRGVCLRQHSRRPCLMTVFRVWFILHFETFVMTFAVGLPFPLSS